MEELRLIKGKNDIELLNLYYKKYTNSLEVYDYIDWAKRHEYIDSPQINQLANSSELHQLSEVEAIFIEILELFQRKAPTKEECIANHFKSLHAKLLMPSQNIVATVLEIDQCITRFHLLDQQESWQPIIKLVKEYQTNQNSLTYEYINNKVITHARKTWHIKRSDISFKEFIGQKVVAIDTDFQFIFELEKGALIIECPWRIRNTNVILLGETDTISRAEEWLSVKELLVGRTIEDIQLFEHCPLLIIQLDNIYLDVFHASSFFDGWTLTDNEDFNIFSMHGGVLA